MDLISKVWFLFGLWRKLLHIHRASFHEFSHVEKALMIFWKVPSDKLLFYCYAKTPLTGSLQKEFIKPYDSRGLRITRGQGRIGLKPQVWLLEWEIENLSWTANSSREQISGRWGFYSQGSPPSVYFRLHPTTLSSRVVLPVVSFLMFYKTCILLRSLLHFLC